MKLGGSCLPVSLKLRWHGHGEAAGSAHGRVISHYETSRKYLAGDI